jgi:hypothetical protein
MAAYEFLPKQITCRAYGNIKSNAKHPCLRDHLITLFHVGLILPSCESSASATKLFYLLMVW